MKKIRITESELVDVIEKLVKENIGNGTGFNFGALGTPTSKYKDLYEDDDIEGDISEQIRIKKGKGWFDIEVTWTWPQLPDWLRKLFIRKNKNKGGKWLKCTLDSCPAWDESSKDEKTAISAEIEGDESKEEATEEFNYDTSQTGDKTVNLNVMKQTNQTDWMGESKITESQLINRLSKKLHEDRWMQQADDDIERRGTEGVFHRYCVDKGYKDGCSPGCWEHAEDAIADGKLDGSLWGRRVGLAKAYCGAKHESVQSQGKLITEKKKKKKKTGKCPESGCITKRGKSWRIISNRTGKLWKAKYDSKKDAEDGLDAYHANK